MEIESLAVEEITEATVEAADSEIATITDFQTMTASEAERSAVRKTAAETVFVDVVEVAEVLHRAVPDTVDSVVAGPVLAVHLHSVRAVITME